MASHPTPNPPSDTSPAPLASRRQLLTTAGVAIGASLIAPLTRSLAMAQIPAPMPSSRPASEPFGYSLNTSTINGSNVPLPDQLEIAAKAGFHALEPWLRDIDAYEKKGGSLTDVAKRAKDLGLVIPSAIGFAQWIVNDDAARAKGLEQMKRDMESVAKLGGTRIAAPPIGAQKPDDPIIDLALVAERYRAVLDLGDQTGVTPECELWGPSKNLHTLAQAAAVAIGSGHPKACILADIYHLYKGGSDPTGLRLLNGSAMHVIHANDYPANPPREQITDAQRCYPGDGIAPLTTIYRDLQMIGFTGYLSLELFNRDYWKQSPQRIAQTGIDKLRASVQKAFA